MEASLCFGMCVDFSYYSFFCVGGWGRRCILMNGRCPPKDTNTERWGCKIQSNRGREASVSVCCLLLVRCTKWLFLLRCILLPPHCSWNAIRASSSQSELLHLPPLSRDTAFLHFSWCVQSCVYFTFHHAFLYKVNASIFSVSPPLHSSMVWVGMCKSV